MPTDGWPRRASRPRRGGGRRAQTRLVRAPGGWCATAVVALGAGNGSRRRPPRPTPGVAGGDRGRHAARAMHQLAPASIVVAARLGASRQKGLGSHRAVVGAVPRGRVRRAPTDVEDLTARIGVGLAVGAIGTSDSGGVRQEVRHRSTARNSVAISASTLTPGGRPARHFFDGGVPFLELCPRRGRSPRRPACAGPAGERAIVPAP
jgi:hypothetical protein